jgi:hypothetical protein
MNSVIALGSFERVPLTIAWPTEDGGRKFHALVG